MATYNVYHPVAVLASSTQTESTNSPSMRLPDLVAGIAFTLNVTAAAQEAADTLDVKVQTQLDGTNWVDVVHFAQVVGNAGAKRHIEKIVPSAAEAGFEDGALGAGTVRNLFGELWRVVTTIVNNTAPSFTFSVMASPM